jgi:16S rRNA (cytosine967-C5)-methyltransferase
MLMMRRLSNVLTPRTIRFSTNQTTTTPALLLHRTLDFHTSIVANAPKATTASKKLVAKKAVKKIKAARTKSIKLKPSSSVLKKYDIEHEDDNRDYRVAEKRSSPPKPVRIESIQSDRKQQPQKDYRIKQSDKRKQVQEDDNSIKLQRQQYPKIVEEKEERRQNKKKQIDSKFKQVKKTSGTDRRVTSDDALKIKFDERHIVTILYRYHVTVAQQKQNSVDKENSGSQYPLDLFISSYMKEHKGIGSNNRRIILNTVYDMTRWMLLLNFLSMCQPFLNKHSWLLTLRDDLYRQQVSHAQKLKEQQDQQRGAAMELFQNKKIVQDIVDWRMKYHIYNLIRPDLQKMSETLEAKTIGTLGANVDIPDNILVSCPAELFDMFEKEFGRETALKLCLVNVTQAPVFVRLNPALVESREYFVKLIQAKLADPTFQSGLSKPELEEIESRKKPLVSVCKTSEWGVRFSKRFGFREWEEYKNGLFEVQDEGSQLVANLVDAQPGQLVLDYCAGSGGKTLAFAHKMKGTGQIYITDIRQSVLTEAKKRARRAGVQNIQPLTINHPQMARIKNKMDWVLVDAPCSGTGTLRRNPELKYRITSEWVSRLTKIQREIFHEAYQYLKKDPNARIIYATCSIFSKENDDQIEYFKKKYGLRSW